MSNYQENVLPPAPKSSPSAEALLNTSTFNDIEFLYCVRRGEAFNEKLMQCMIDSRKFRLKGKLAVGEELQMGTLSKTLLFQEMPAIFVK